MTWFHPPQLRIGDDFEEQSRHATWLELFFDLVFVVAVSQLAHNLSADVSIQGFLGFVFLFLPVWWSWIGATFYANRFDVDDAGHRVLTAVQMLAIASMAVNIHHGLDKSSVGFALSYVIVRLMLVFQYLRAAIHLPQARGLACRYAIGFAIAAAFWLVSVFVPIPARFFLWMLGLLVDFATPLTSVKLQTRLLPNFEHLPERFGLFTIIVLGEAIIAVVNGIAEQNWNLPSVIAAALGFSIAFSLWWIYFENVGGSALRSAPTERRVSTLQVWLYGHLPLVIGLAGTGVGVEHIIKSQQNIALVASERWLLCGSVALCLAALAVLHRTGVIFRCKVRYKYRSGASIVLLVIALAGEPLLPTMVVGLVAIICITQVFQDIYQGHPAAPTLEDFTKEPIQ
jgi:low temperature requirement protein LtrA